MHEYKTLPADIGITIDGQKWELSPLHRPEGPSTKRLAPKFIHNSVISFAVSHTWRNSISSEGIPNNGYTEAIMTAVEQTASEYLSDSDLKDYYVWLDYFSTDQHSLFEIREATMKMAWVYSAALGDKLRKIAEMTDERKKADALLLVIAKIAMAAHQQGPQDHQGYHKDGRSYELILSSSGLCVVTSGVPTVQAKVVKVKEVLNDLSLYRFNSDACNTRSAEQMVEFGKDIPQIVGKTYLGWSDEE
ncbi:hypothetical protein HDU81_001877 [Chytriomyces hyalinus]|nr:hypothetical protein HDU81_001877 [Chytriomyces hyalinus]